MRWSFDHAHPPRDRLRPGTARVGLRRAASASDGHCGKVGRTCSRDRKRRGVTDIDTATKPDTWPYRYACLDCNARIAITHPLNSDWCPLCNGRINRDTPADSDTGANSLAAGTDAATNLYPANTDDRPAGADRR